MTSPFSRKSKSAKEAENTDLTMDDVSKEAKGLVDKILSDVGKSSATKQLLFGSISGWFTGYLMMKVGKAAAISVGGGIILLQIANHNGYVKVNWDRIYRNVEDQVDKIEASSSTKGPKILDKVEKFVDRKLDKAESMLKKKEQKAKKWFNKVSGREDEIVFQDIHVFLASYIAGLALGLAFGKVI